MLGKIAVKLDSVLQKVSTDFYVFGALGCPSEEVNIVKIQRPQSRDFGRILEVTAIVIDFSWLW